ncbi:histidine kinase [Mariniphaga sediminis]|uniref:Histidine kinase n=2 Tax=Mariniphaga sediminis TaxID=1628158 RepID=A0A399D4Z1_9BACT|nr:histidine kinase [Mariniphaga sediminis]
MKNRNEIREKVLKGLEIYQERLIQTKKVRNLELVVSDDEGRVVRIPAHEL